MDVRFWGVRGSIAVSGGEFHRTGGNTTCVALTHDGGQLILDGGTGLQALGRELMSTHGPAVDTTILFTHVHWDHIQGVPFFGPAFCPDSRIRFGGAPGLEAALTQQMRPPTFPVGLDTFSAHLDFLEIGAGPQAAALQIGPFTIRASEMSHPNGVLVYRVEAGGRSVVFATDVEHGDRLDPRMLELAEGADLLIHDAQYTNQEYRGHAGPGRRGWGHSTWEQAVGVAWEAQVGQLALFHHDPTRTDGQVAQIESIAARRLRGTFAAREGSRVAL